KATNRLAEAEPLMRRALAIDEQSYGAEHPNVARNLSNLVVLLQDTNRLAEAEPLIRRALAIFEQSFGPEHPSVAVSLNVLSLLLQATNRFAEAEPLIRRALVIGEQSYGADHPEVAVWLNNLAQLLDATNRLAEAEPLMRRALAIGEQSYGSEHPKVAIRLNNLAQLLKATNRLAEAEPLMRRCVVIFQQFGRKTGHEHPGMKTVLANYRDILQLMMLPDDEVAERLKDTAAIAGPLKPIVPEVERVLGPAKPVADVLAALDRQYKADGKPAVYFLRPDQPMAPHLEDLFRPNSESLNAAGVNAYRNGDHANAIAHYEESLKLLADNPDQATTTFTTRMNRAAALRELGEVEQARDELRRLLSGLKEGNTITVLGKGRARYHLALCERRLGDPEAALREAEESLKEYGDDEAAAAQKKQTEQLLADLKNNKPLPPLAKGNAVAALEQARGRFRARAGLATLPLNQSAVPLLDQMLGPAPSTKEVFEALDRQYREQNKPEIWFLPLNKPIAPHLDELLGPVPKTEKEE
ncbi:MAG: tetratricopeptide repeat protein, partial [Planctomycetota bacterium]